VQQNKGGRDTLCWQVVWSTGAKSLILWDAYTGGYLGSISRSSEAELERESQRFRYENSERDERFVPRLQIDHRRVRPPPPGTDTHTHTMASTPADPSRRTHQDVQSLFRAHPGGEGVPRWIRTGACQAEKNGSMTIYRPFWQG
jgi:hypothetical protein